MTKTHALPCKICKTPTPIADSVVQQVFAMRLNGFPKAKITATTCRACVNDRDGLGSGEVLDDEHSQP